MKARALNCKLVQFGENFTPSVKYLAYSSDIHEMDATQRVWQDIEGKQHEGAFAGLFQNRTKIKLRKPNGGIIALPVDRLSQNDKKYLQTILENEEGLEKVQIARPFRELQSEGSDKAAIADSAFAHIPPPRPSSAGLTSTLNVSSKPTPSPSRSPSFAPMILPSQTTGPKAKTTYYDMNPDSNTPYAISYSSLQPSSETSVSETTATSIKPIQNQHGLTSPSQMFTKPVPTPLSIVGSPSTKSVRRLEDLPQFSPITDERLAASFYRLTPTTPPATVVSTESFIAPLPSQAVAKKDSSPIPAVTHSPAPPSTTTGPSQIPHTRLQSPIDRMAAETSKAVNHNLIMNDVLSSVNNAIAEFSLDTRSSQLTPSSPMSTDQLRPAWRSSVSGALSRQLGPDGMPIPNSASSVSSSKYSVETILDTVLTRICEYLDVFSFVNLHATSHLLRARLQDPIYVGMRWATLQFDIHSANKVDHNRASALIHWLRSKHLIRYVKVIHYDDTMVQEITILHTLENYPNLEHISTFRCPNIYSYPLANLLMLKATTRSFSIPAFRSWTFGGSLTRGSLPQNTEIIQPSISFGQDIDLIELAMNFLASATTRGFEIKFDIFLCQYCETGACYPIFSCSFCGDVPVKKCWNCTPMCDRCERRACGVTAGCKRDFEVSTKGRECGRCTFGVALCGECKDVPSCTKCGKWFHKRCNYEMSCQCHRCKKIKCPFCDLETCFACRSQYCSQSTQPGALPCSDIKPCQCGRGRAICAADQRQCQKCNEEASASAHVPSPHTKVFCSICIEEHWKRLPKHRI